MDYQVVTFDPVTGQATYGTPPVPTILTGINKLVQIVVLELLRNPGRSVLEPTEGPGFRADIGTFNFTGDGTEIRALAVTGVRTSQQEILGRQSSNSGTPQDRLKQLILLNFAYDDLTGKALLNVKIINEAGDSTTVLV